MSALIYWFCALIVLAAVVFPGYLVSRLLFRKLDDGEHLCVGPFLSIPIVVVLWLLIRPLGDVVWTTVFLVGVLICSAAALRRGQLRRGLPLLILATLAGHLVVCGVVQLFWDSPHAGGDFFLHIFRVPYAFLNNDSLAGDRTALFSLFSMAFSGSFGGDLRDQWLYQLSFVVGNSLILAPMVLFAHRFGGPLAGRIALVVGIVNPYFIFNAVFTWPKLISSAAVMVSVYLLFYHRSKLTSAAAAFVAAIGVFCHPSAGILLLPAGLVWLFRRGFKSRLGELLVAIMTVAITFLVFFFWTTSKGYAPGASVLLKCPILVEGWQTGYGVPWPEAWQRFCDATIGEILDRRVTTFLASFTPSTGNPTPYYHESVPGALGVFVLVGSMIGSVSLWRRAKPQRPVRALLVLMLLWPLVAIVFSGCEYTGLGETPVKNTPSKPANFRYGPKSPPELASAQVPVRGDLPTTVYRPLPRAGVPVRGPVMNPSMLPGPRGSVPGSMRS